METTLAQTLQQGVAAHKEGKLQDAERFYRAILQSQPGHPDANHNLGVLAVSVDKAGAALPLFKAALEANPKIEQFWLSYIDALIKLGQLDNARRVLQQGRAYGLKGDEIDRLLVQFNNTINPAPSPIGTGSNPSKQEIDGIITLFSQGQLQESLALGTALEIEYPNDPKLRNVLGAIYAGLSKYEEAITSYKKALVLKPDYAKVHNNLGITLKELGSLNEAEACFNQAIELKPDFADAYWNLHGIQKTLEDAEYCIDKCLKADENHVWAKLMKAALRFYQGDKSNFDELMQSELKQHSYMRSFSWVFSLPKLPELHFDKWHFFDAIIKKSITTRPFYEFGVWRASSFKYLIKVFKKGYGFDTFTGLPEDWDTGRKIEKKGTYTSDGNVPEIKGGEFVVGKFEDTLPVFFSESRPIASVINFDADLYSSTICALNFSKNVMDKDTILIFDEFITNESWEQDEFKALNEFCSNHHCSYEVIAVSFCTKQVAIKLIGI